MTEVIRYEHVDISYKGKRVVHDVSFSVEKGEILGIVGESGSGKSTLIKAAMGLLGKDGLVTRGDIWYKGMDLPDLKPREMRKLCGPELGMIFQTAGSSFCPIRTVRAQLYEFTTEHKKIKADVFENQAEELLEKFGFEDPKRVLDSYPFELSGGMCQRVIIAMAVCGHPKLIIADEPTTALDVTVQAQVLELLKDLQKKLNTAILLITHNLGVVWEMCDTVMVMYAGNTVEYADTKTLYQEPLHPYTWGLLDSMPKLSSSAKEDLKTIPGTPPDLRLTGYCCNFYNRCPYATEICKNQVPPLKEVAPGHFVACHRQDGEHRLTRGEVNETCRKM